MKLSALAVIVVAAIELVISASPVAITMTFTQKSQLIKHDSGIDWNLSPEQILSSCSSEIAKARQKIKLITARLKTVVSFADGLGAIESAVADLNDALVAQKLLADVATDKAVREASTKCNEDIAAFRVEISADPAIYALAKRAQTQATTLADRQLAMRFVEAGRRSGAELDDISREELVGLFDQLDKLQIAFQQALADDHTSLSISKDEAASLPAAFVATLDRRQDEYVVPVDLRTYETFMRNAASSSARRRYLDAFFNRGGKENTRRVEEAIALRHRIARRLGFDNWAAYQLDSKMAKRPERALALLREVNTKLLPKARAEISAMAAMKLAEGDTTPFSAWDYPYYQQQVEKTRHTVNSEIVRQYFPVEKVIPAVLRIYQLLLGVRFESVNPSNAWAPDVQQYSITDARKGTQLGWFYLDLVPRAGKYLRPANFVLRAGRRLPEGGYRLPISSIIGNGPAAAPGQPALFSHRDTIEFFHEFGHLMHTTLSTAQYASLYGANVRGDFVEAPSQMLENWMWQRSILKRVSSHAKTNEPLPDDMIDRMIALKHAAAGVFWTRQSFLAVYDLTLHSSGERVDANKLWLELMPQLTPLPPMSATMPAASFMPIMGGYDGGYYGYVWSRVYAQDIFTAFEQGGLNNQKIGMRYRRLILEPGGTVEPEDMLKNFLGRPLKPDAFYRDLGIQGTASTN